MGYTWDRLRRLVPHLQRDWHDVEGDDNPLVTFGQTDSNIDLLISQSCGLGNWDHDTRRVPSAAVYLRTS